MEKLDYTEIIFTLPAEHIERAGDIANMANTGGIYIEDYRDLEQDVRDIAHIDLIDEDLLSKDKSVGKIHLYLDMEKNVPETVLYVEELLRNANIPFETELSECRYEDWAENWKKYFKPVKIGEKLLITPLWEKVEREKTDRVEMLLEPGMAFGTGTHETTRLCLELIEKYMKKDCTMLDVGCGSGILAICSLLLGAKKGVGVDIDAMSVKTAIENAELNGVSENFEGIVGSLTEKVEGKYDIIAANIVADVLLFLNKDIKQFLKEDGIYIMSGIIDLREKEILDSLEGEFKVLDIRRERGWTAIAVSAI